MLSVNNDNAMANPEEILLWAWEAFGESAILVTSLTPEDQVLVDMVSKHVPRMKVMVLNPKHVGNDGEDLLEQTRKRYGLDIEKYAPLAQCPTRTDAGASSGCDEWEVSADGFSFLCERPFSPQFLMNMRVLILGDREPQQRADPAIANAIGWHMPSGLVLVRPLTGWTHEQVCEYIRKNQVPCNEPDAKLSSDANRAR